MKWVWGPVLKPDREYKLQGFMAFVESQENKWMEPSRAAQRSKVTKNQQTTQELSS